MKLRNTARTHYYEITLSRNWGDTYDKTYISLKGKFIQDNRTPLLIDGTFKNTGARFEFDNNVKEISKNEYFAKVTPENIFRPGDSSITVNERLSNQHKEVAEKETSWEKKMRENEERDNALQTKSQEDTDEKSKDTISNRDSGEIELEEKEL